MSIGQQVIFAVLAGVAMWVTWQWAKRAIARGIVRRWDERRARSQPLAFLRRLHDAAAGDPFGTMQHLFSDQRDGFARKLWTDSRPPAAVRGSGQPGPIEADQIRVHRTHLEDGRAIAVIALPPPERNGEPYLAAVVLPADPLLAQDPARAQRSAFLFHLNRGSSESRRETDLCGWTPDGLFRTYNVGAPTDAEGFARAVGAKLRELGW